MDNKDTVLNEEQIRGGKAQELAEEKMADAQELTDELMEDVDGGEYIFSTIKQELYSHLGTSQSSKEKHA